MNWIEATASLSRENRGFVIVTILSVEGSSPRDSSTKMVVDSEQIHDTIGGGNLEYQCMEFARQLIAAGKSVVKTKTFSLGKDLTQCCGGRVTVLFECFPRNRFNVVLFGAGHVGKSLATILSRIPCRLRWIDSRPSMVEEIRNDALFESVDIQLSENPVFDIEKCAPHSYYLVMTHSHEIDMELVEAILSRPDIAFCGLIGSRSKSVKFRNRLKRRGFSDEEIARMVSPIGLTGLGGKSPMEVAVSVAAQLMQLHRENVPESTEEPNKKRSVTGSNILPLSADIKD